MFSDVLVAFLFVLLAVWVILCEWCVKFGNKSTQGPPVQLLCKSELGKHDFRLILVTYTNLLLLLEVSHI